jgi:hypothetical protein
MNHMTYRALGSATSYTKTVAYPIHIADSATLGWFLFFFFSIFFSPHFFFVLVVVLISLSNILGVLKKELIWKQFVYISNIEKKKIKFTTLRYCILNLFLFGFCLSPYSSLLFIVNENIKN